MKKPINLSKDSNEIKQVANGRLCCAIRCRRFTVSNGLSLIPESMCNPSRYAVLAGAEKGDQFIPPALQKLRGSCFS